MARNVSKNEWLLLSESGERRVPASERIVIDDENWRLVNEQLDVGDGMRIFLSTADVRGPVTLEPRQNVPGAWLKANVAVKGRVMLSLTDGPSADITQDCSVLFRDFDRRARYTPAPRQALQLAGYMLRNDRVARMFDGEIPEIICPLLKRTVRAGKVFELPADARLRQLAASLFTRRLNGPLHAVFLEGVILQLLAIQAAAAAGSEEPQPAQALSVRERTAIEEARERLLVDMSNPPTLGELASAVGMSEKRLNAGFKALYGATVFETLRNERLEHARIALEGGDVPIKEVAFRVGYNHVTNFINAFTARYGAPPRQYGKE